MVGAFKRACCCAWFLALLLGALPPRVRAAEAELISAQTPWRAYLVLASPVYREAGVAKVRGKDGKLAPFDAVKPLPETFRTSSMPPADWLKPDADDVCWPRYIESDLADFLGDYGAEVGDPGRALWPARLCLRTCFGIADPGKVSDLKLKLVVLGGAVAYVNGQEAGRSHLPQGEVAPMTPADDYPPETYVGADGTTPLPGFNPTQKVDAKLTPHYDKRIRTLTIDIPARLLVKGRNVLALALHRAALAGPFQRGGWSHVGFREARLVSVSGAGVVPYAEAAKGTHVWSASPVDQVAEKPSEKSLIKRNWFWTLYSGRGMPVKGIPQGNPYDPLLPLKLTMPRNGVGSGQTILSDPDGLKNISAKLGALKGPSGAVLAASGVQIRYALQQPDFHYCDALLEQPPEGARTVPVWLIVQAAKDQAPGWYAGTLDVEANGKKFAVPVQVWVTGLALPDAKDFSSSVGFPHSPETIAKQYKVEWWSEKHLQLMEKSLALLGQVGNDAVHIPVIVSGVGGTGKSGTRFNWHPLIYWVKTEQGLKPDFTFLEKYLDLYAKYCAPPRGISLYIWGASSAKEVADAYENRRIPTRENTKYSPPKVFVRDAKTGAFAAEAVPAIGDEGSEQFWKPMLEGVRALVVKRGWSERAVMLGLGGDIRPGQRTAELLKQWAPYARWDFLSHFSGDPGPKDGKMIATGGMEVGMMEWPSWTSGFRAAQLEERVNKPLDFLELPTDRWMHQPYSPPLIFRTMVATWGCLGRIGLDFWLARAGGPCSTSFFSHVEHLTFPGPDGTVPTVRFQLLREGIQDSEIKRAMVKAYLALPEEQRKPYRALIDELPNRAGACGHFYLSQCELLYDWPSYVAKVHAAASELAGAKMETSWAGPTQ